ncbi:retrovirus-related pol polyprotein from transposon TNT 1-94 [Tanacetum coccineum]|uniref:Retrovirus-related pol polyprotein from transposon TNT 1-94 n=1 Tax=Tanacetum coccineum TaxID=301880 RepID=A0ABQ5CKH0_9ASTR
MASTSPICLIACATSTKSWLWHQRLSHLNFDTINDLAKNDLVTGLPKFKYHKEHLCPSCEQGKSKKVSHPPKPIPNSKQRLYLLHMDLCGLMRVESIKGKRYVLVIMDDYSRYTWVHFLRSKDEAPKVIKTFLKKITVLLQSPVIIVRTDNGIEIKNQVLQEYFDSVGISQQSSSVRTPQQNGVVERRNRTLVKAARTILIFSCAPLFLWAEAIATAVYNRRMKKIMETMNVTFDELSDMTFEQHNSKPRLQSMTSRQISSGLDFTYAPSTITTQKPTEHNQALLQPEIVADNVPNALFDGDVFENPFAPPSTSAAESSSLQYVDSSNMKMFYQPYPYEYQWTKDHPLEQVIGEPSRPVLTWNQLRIDGDMCMYALTMSIMEPRNVKEAMTDPLWIESTQEELLQFKRIDVWVLVPAPDNIKPLTLKFSDADYAGCKDTFKSTSGGTQFLCEKLVSRSSKKQDCSALSTIETEYVSLSACCAQVLWMRTQLTDYGFHFNKIPIYYDSKSAIAISCNPVQHSRTKHIAVHYHFIKEHVEKGTIELYLVKTDYQLADLFTKALPVDRFNYLVRCLGMRSLSLQELERLAKSQ